MVENELIKKDEHEITLAKDIDQLMLIIKERKVFWTVIPIDLINVDGKKYQAGFDLVLAGIAPEREEYLHDEREENLYDGSEGKVFKDLEKIANWLVPKDDPNNRCEIEVNISSFFYVSGDLDPKRRNYVLRIRICNKGGMDEPVDIHQREALKEMQEKLKQIGSPKNQWKEHPTTI